MIGVKCIICNGFCELDEEEKNILRHGYQVVKVCDHCKEVIEWLKTSHLEKIKNT